ncbi:hypothetical protein [Desulfohalovibrio reitneri]|uniref:hypothetical protein n=1 Tax=Desulfohalovibrio reitneri TaxID=1307759 RepID=UPI0004A6D285|nr:hypothetical protein [Desulfohalovibrio reitneri]
MEPAIDIGRVNSPPLGRAGKAGPRMVRVELRDVTLSARARATIGDAFLQISRRYGVPYERLKRAVSGRIWVNLERDTLNFRFEVPELEADMLLTIPGEHWDYRFASPSQH